MTPASPAPAFASPFLRIGSNLVRKDEIQAIQIAVDPDTNASTATANAHASLLVTLYGSCGANPTLICVKIQTRFTNDVLGFLEANLNGTGAAGTLPWNPSWEAPANAPATATDQKHALATIDKPVPPHIRHNNKVRYLDPHRHDQVWITATVVMVNPTRQEALLESCDDSYSYRRWVGWENIQPDKAVPALAPPATPLPFPRLLPPTKSLPQLPPHQLTSTPPTKSDSCMPVTIGSSR